MSYNKAYKVRIYPNEVLEVLLAKTFGCVRLVYNYYLDCKIKAYETNKKSMSYNDCAKDLVSLKKDRSFLKEVDSISLQQSLRHLDTAYQNFFRDKKVGFPKFKSKKNHHFSYSTVCVNNNIRLEDGYLILPKIKAKTAPYFRTSNPYFYNIIHNNNDFYQGSSSRIQSLLWGRLRYMPYNVYSFFPRQVFRFLS